jgi:hypothetical protein
MVTVRHVAHRHRRYLPLANMTAPANDQIATPRTRHAIGRIHKTVTVRVGSVLVGGGAPVTVQSMTMTDTAHRGATARQCIELAEAGAELVRVTVNGAAAAAAVPEIKQRMLDAGCAAPLIGDFHYNGHLLLTQGWAPRVWYGRHQP